VLSARTDRDRSATPSPPDLSDRSDRPRRSPSPGPVSPARIDPPSTPTALRSEATLDHETDAPSDLALSVDTAPVQAALAALVDPDPQDDWWAHKLLADREATPQRRIAAYQAAMARFPDRSELRRGLACQLALAGAADDAERLFRALIDDLPGDAGLHIDLAVLSALNRDFVRAEALADEAWQLTRVGERNDAIIAAVAFARGLLARLQHRDDTAALRVLRGVLRTTAIQPGGLTPMLAVVVASLDRRGLVLDRPSHRLYHRLLACLTGQATPESLEANQRWAELTPLAPDAAWPAPA